MSAEWLAISNALAEATEKTGAFTVAVHTEARVAEVLADRVRLADGREIPAELAVWAAGVKAPAFLAELDGLEVNRINQLNVLPTLQTTRLQIKQ